MQRVKGHGQPHLNVEVLAFLADAVHSRLGTPGVALLLGAFPANLGHGVPGGANPAILQFLYPFPPLFFVYTWFG